MQSWLVAQPASIVREFVHGLENLQTMGRNGLHRYNNQTTPCCPASLDVYAVIARLRAVFLDELGRLRRAYGFMMNQWAQRGQPTIVRNRPTYTERGKFLPVRSLGRTRT